MGWRAIAGGFGAFGAVGRVVEAGADGGRRGVPWAVAELVEAVGGAQVRMLAEGERDVYPSRRNRCVCGAGEGVGGIALLRDVPRTATVRARDGVVLPALDRDSFLQAVGSQAPAARAAHRIADERTPRT